MKTRLLGVLVGMALSFALPSYAQQKDLVDTQTTQKILTIRKEYDEAINNNDAPPLPRFSHADVLPSER